MFIFVVTFSTILFLYIEIGCYFKIKLIRILLQRQRKGGGSFIKFVFVKCSSDYSKQSVKHFKINKFKSFVNSLLSFGGRSVWLNWGKPLKERYNRNQIKNLSLKRKSLLSHSQSCNIDLILFI